MLLFRERAESVIGPKDAPTAEDELTFEADCVLVVADDGRDAEIAKAARCRRLAESANRQADRLVSVHRPSPVIP